MASDYETRAQWRGYPILCLSVSGQTKKGSGNTEMVPETLKDLSVRFAGKRGSIAAKNALFIGSKSYFLD
jgi:hypothetical protein